jgi:predicted Zn-dependent peptidase
MVGLYFVTDSRKLGRCMEVVREELRLLRGHGFTDEEFERARNMTRSSVLLALEGPTSRMMRLARTYQLLGRTVTVDETVDGLAGTTRDDVSRLIGELLDGEFRLAGAVGPLSESEFAGLIDAGR